MNKQGANMRRKNKTQEKKQTGNFSPFFSPLERQASKSFFLFRSIKKKNQEEEAYENQYSDALLQAPYFNLSSCGKSLFRGPFTYKYSCKKIMSVNQWKFMYIAKGEGCLSLEGKEYILKKGDVILEPLFADFQLTVKKGQILERYFFDFTGNIAESFFLTPELTGYTPHILSAPESGILSEFFEELLLLGRENPADASFRASKLIYSFLLDVWRVKKHTSKDIRYKLYSILEPLTFKKYDLDMLADSAGMSRRTLNRFFAKYMGMTPVEYIRVQKINYAAHALRSTNISISELARICAYSSPSYFTRDFRRLMGKSPMEYQKDAGDENLRSRRMVRKKK